MDWSVILEVSEPGLEEDGSLQSSLYEFMLESDLPSKDEDPANFVKYLSVMRELMKLKFVDAKCLEEELEELHSRQSVMEDNVGLSEEDLLEKIAMQDKELRQQHSQIQQLQERAGAPPPSTTNEIRRLREELEDLRHENTGVNRSLEYEKAETDRLTHEVAAEKLKTRQLERRLEELHATVDDYHGQVQRSRGKVGVEEDNNYRQKIIEKEVEYSKLLDDFQLMANSFEETKNEMKSLSVRLEEVEQHKMAVSKDAERMRRALTVSDSRCDELETRNSLLEAQVSDLQERLNDQSGADQQIMTMISSKAKEWESVLSSKQTELDSCQGLVRDLEGQLRVALRQTDRATLVNMKKRLQEQDKQLSTLQRELSEAVQTITHLTDQLEESKEKNNAGPVGLHREVEGLEVKVQSLERELAMEDERRKKAERSGQQKDLELSHIRKRIWDYENNVVGLREAVETIKKKKEELTVRDNDIAEMTRQVNRLENGLNQLSEENEALRDQLGLQVGERVDLSPLRRRKQTELEQLRKDYKLMESEVENLKEDNLSLRKQLLHATVSKVESTNVRISAQANGSESGLVQELQSRVDQLERECERERREKEEGDRERERLRGIIRERIHEQGAVDGSSTTSKEQTHQLQTDISVLTGQNKELREMIVKAEKDGKEAVRELQRKQHQVESLEQEILNLKRSKAGFQPLPLPQGISPTSNDVIASLNEHLLQVLGTLHQREKEVGVAQEALEKFQRKFSVIIHQQGILYKEYSDARKEWECQKERLTADNQRLAAHREQDQVHVQQLKILKDHLNSDPDDLKRKMADQSRKMTLVLVNERALSRKFTLVQESEKHLRKENDRLSHDIVRLERAVTERIGYLQRHKETSVFQLSSLQTQLSESVPLSLLDKANSEYNELVIKYQDLLQKQTSYTATATTIEHLQSEVKTLSDQLESVKEELHTEKQKNNILSQTTSSHPSSVGTRGEAERLATLEIKELNERQRADLATTRCRQLQETLLQLEQRNSSLEDKFSDFSHKLLQSQSREVELRDQLASSLTEKDKYSLESQIAQLVQSESQHRSEHSQLKEVSEVARQQVVAMEMKQTSRDIELSSLRHQLLDLQMQTDDKTMLGKLHHQIVALQVSEAKTMKRFEESSVKVSKLEASLLRCEQQRDALNETVFHVRAESQNKMKHFRASIQALRRQFVGCLPLCEQERHASILQQLAEDKREAERMREEARKSMEAGQDKLSELELQHSNLQELLGALRDHSKTSTAAAKLTEWHAKLGEMRLTEMRNNRISDRLREKIKHLEELLASSESSFTKLERDLVQVTKDYESSQIRWEQREMELESELEEIKKKKREVFGGVDAELDGPEIDKLLEQAIHSSHSHTDTISKLKRESSLNKDRADKLEKALRETQRVLLEREKEVAALRVRTSEPSEQIDYVDRTLEMERQLEVAMETVDQLKMELSTKERQADKYQRLLQEARQELKDHAHNHKREMASLTEKLHSHSDSTFSKLKEAALEVANLPQPKLPTDRQLDRLRELEDLSADQEGLITQLRTELGETKRDLDQAEQDSETRLTRLRQSMNDMTTKHRKELQDLQSSLEDKSSRVIELEQELEVLDGELSAAQQAAKQAPSRTMKALVERLRNQLSLKEKQQRALSQALLQVRADLVETAQRTVEGEASREIQEANIKQLVEKRTSILQDRIRDLSERQDDLTHQLEDTRYREQEREDELSACRTELGDKKSQVQRLTSELEQKKRGLEQAKSRERKLANEIHELHVRLEQSPPEVEELQKRIRILQGKLEKQKNETTRSASLKVVGNRKSVGTNETTPQVDDKHRTVEILKWEESKKWQRKADTLRSRLIEKQRELEGAMKTVHSLKETLARSDREKGILQGKLRGAHKTVTDSTPGHSLLGKGEGSDQQFSEERHALQTKIFVLEGEVSRLKRESSVSKDSEMFELKMKCEQLVKTVEALEEQLQQQHPGSSEQLHRLRERERQLEEELLQSQKEGMSLRFDYEQAALELPRLKGRVEDQQQYIEVLQSAEGAGNVRAQTASKKDPSGSHSVSELERVINAMRKVIDRLQNENESLKTKTRTSQSKSSHKLTALERENKRLKSEAKSLTDAQSSVLSITEDEQGSHRPSGLKSPYRKIVAENERLRKELKKEQDQIDKLHLSLSTLELQNNKLRHDLDSTSRPDQPFSASNTQPQQDPNYEERLVRLETELEKKTTMLMEVKRHLREAADREKQLKSLTTDPNISDRYLAVTREKVQLQEQVVQLKKELDAFDPSFFEEIEDLKYNYQEAVRKNVQFEEQLKRLSEQYGFPLKQLDT